MSGLIKSVFHSLFVCMFFPSAILMAQEVPSEGTTDFFTSKIQDPEAKMVALREFDTLVNQYNSLMKERRYAEAELVAKKARELNADEPAAFIMVEKAKFMRQSSFNSDARSSNPGAAVEDKHPSEEFRIGGTQFVIVEASPGDSRADVIRQIVQALEDSNNLGLPNKLTQLSGSGITVQLRVLMEEAGGEALTELLQGMGQLKLTDLRVSLDRDETSNKGIITASEEASIDAIARVQSYLTTQKYMPLTVTTPPEKPLSDTVLRNAAAEIEDDADAEHVKMFSLKSSNAKDASEIIHSLFGFPTVKVATDQRTNSIVVSSDKSTLTEIEAILLKLDSTETAAQSSATAEQSPASPQASAIFIAESRRRLNDLERPVLLLAEKVRSSETSLGKDDPDSIKQRADLRVLVQQTFAARQEIQQAELAEFTRRLEGMKESIDARERIAEKIVDRRLDELLDPDISWEALSSRLNGPALPISKSLREIAASGVNAATNLITKTYSVGNYVSATFFEQAISTQNSAASLDAAADKIRQKAEELITQISSHNKPAAISFDSARLQLVVSHNAEGHRALDELFVTLKLPMQEKLTFSRYAITNELYSALKDSPVWKAYDPMRNQLEEGRWIGIPQKQLVSWFKQVWKESPEARDISQPTPYVLAAGVPHQFDAGEIRVVLTARIDPASQKSQLRIDYTDLAGRPSGTRMISDLDHSAVWIPSTEESLHFLVYERNEDNLRTEVNLSQFAEPQTAVPKTATDSLNAAAEITAGIPSAANPELDAASFVQNTIAPKSDAEKAIARLVLVFFRDEARRAVPGLMIDHGTETLILTTGPATIVPDGVSHAIDRTFVEVPDATAVEAKLLNTKTADIRIHRAKRGLTQFLLKEPVAPKVGDSLSAIILSGQPALRVTPNAARISDMNQATSFSLATHKFRHEFTGLVQIDQRLPEGTPLFKDGELAGITLLGTRFMKDDVPGSFVVPASRIVEVLQQLKTE